MLWRFLSLCSLLYHERLFNLPIIILPRWWRRASRLSGVSGVLRFGGRRGVFTISKQNRTGASATAVVSRHLALMLMSFPTPLPSNVSLSGVIVVGYLLSLTDSINISAFLAWLKDAGRDWCSLRSCIYSTFQHWITSSINFNLSC